MQLWTQELLLPMATGGFAAIIPKTRIWPSGFACGPGPPFSWLLERPRASRWPGRLPAATMRLGPPGVGGGLSPTTTNLVCDCGVPQFQLPQRTPGQTRQARGGRQRPPGGAWAGPGAHCGVGPAWVLGGFFLPSASPISARDRLAAHFCSNTDHERVCHCAPLARLLHRRLPPKGRAPPRRQGRRATGRPSPPRSRR